MKLLVLGATGATGQELVRQALAKGHDVTVLVRSPAKILSENARLRVEVGSVMDPVAVEEAVAGQDAVLSALGVNDPRELFSASLMTRTAVALIPSMQRQGVDRIIVLSALGVGQSAHLAPAILRIMFKTLFRWVGGDKARSEAELTKSGLDWTVVYPPQLDNGPATGAYRAGEDLMPRRLTKVSRADVAGFMLAQLEDVTYSKRIVVLSR